MASASDGYTILAASHSLSAPNASDRLLNGPSTGPSTGPMSSPPVAFDIRLDVARPGDLQLPDLPQVL